MRTRFLILSVSGLLALLVSGCSPSEKTIRIDESVLSSRFPAVWLNPGTGEFVPMESRSESPTEPGFSIWVEPGDPEFVPGKGVTDLKARFAGFGREAFENPDPSTVEPPAGEFFTSENAAKKPVVVIEGPEGNCAIMFTVVDPEANVMEFQWRRL